MYVCMYVCIYVSIYLSMYLCMYVCIGTRLSYRLHLAQFKFKILFSVVLETREVDAILEKMKADQSVKEAERMRDTIMDGTGYDFFSAAFLAIWELLLRQ